MKAPSWIGKTLGGRYQIEQLLGQGGMSAVYKGNDPNLRRAVAIKLIHSHLSTDAQFVRRFEDEAAAVAQLRHSNIIQVYDFNQDEGTYYMVMELVPGETLQERLRRYNSTQRFIPIEKTITYTTQICAAIDYAHKRGMIHRDIKPANIMIDVHDQAILMDFGIAKMVGAEKFTATGAVVGTALYMPPEVIRAEVVDPRSDIYSLGVTLYEMISGKPPFEADSAMTLLMMHLNDPVPDLTALRPDAPPQLVAVVERALAKDRSERFASAADMAQALQAVLPWSGSPAAGISATLVEQKPLAARNTQPRPETKPETNLQTEVEPPPAAVAGDFLTEHATEIDVRAKPLVDPATALDARENFPSAPATEFDARAKFPSAPVVEPKAGATNVEFPARLPAKDLNSSQPQAAAPASSARPAPSPRADEAIIFTPPAARSATVSQAAPQTRTAGVNLLNPYVIGAALLGIILLVIVAGVIIIGIPLLRSAGASGVTPTGAPSAAPSVTLPALVAVGGETATPTLLPSATHTPAPSETAAPTLTPTPSATPTPELFVLIRGITLENNAYIVDYETFGYTEALPGMHVHFFFNTVTPENAGMPGSGPWILYGGPRPFTGYKASDRPAQATQMCALVANANHSIILNSGTCQDLP